MSITIRSLAVLVLVSLAVPSAFAQGPEPWMMGAGASWFDCDNDGDLDLLYLKGEGNVYLFTNNKGHFTDASEAIPAAVRNNDRKPSIGVACADLNNDTWIDIVISKAGRMEDNGVSKNILLLNNQDGTFRDASTQSGMGLEHFTSSIAPIDYDNDGDLDLFMVNYRLQPNYLYRNDGVDEEGNVSFTDVADIAGVQWPDGYPTSHDGGTAALGVAVGDYDNDGDADIYVVNDFEVSYMEQELLPAPNQLYRNNGDGTFTDVSEQTGADQGGHAMGVTFGDYNNDGWLDIFVANFWEDALLENNQDGTFTDVTVEKGVILDTPEYWHLNGWGTALFDYDNDGDLDLHVGNGYILNGVGQTAYEPDQLFENLGEGQDWRFVDRAPQAGVDQTGDSRGVAYGDYNRDGLLDMFIINTDFILVPGEDPGPARRLYKNMGNGTFQDVGYQEGLRDDSPDSDAPNGYKNFWNNKWLQIRVIGAFNEDTYPQGSPITPIGTRVTVTAGGNTWMQDFGASSYASQNSPYMHFGLGQVSSITEVRVRFPRGAELVFDGNDIEPNSILTVHEVDGITEIVPVRLMGYHISRDPGGALLSWSYEDDNDLAFFFVEREVNGNVETLATDIVGVNGSASFLDADPVPGQVAFYSVGAVLRTGKVEILGTQAFRYDVFSGTRLKAPRPNPFAGGTGIPVLASRAGKVDIDILDINGRLVRQLNQVVAAGETLVAWDGADLQGMQAPAGVYYARVQGSQTSAVKLIKMP